MASFSPIDNLSKQLINHDTHQQTLHAILQHAARGHDVSQAAERVVRHCLYSPSGPTPQILSLSIDVLIASPSHAFWVDTLSILIENLRRTSTPACLVILLKIPLLPHTALQHLLLYSSTVLTECLSNDESPSVRRAAVHAIVAFTLRTRPLTAPATDAIRLEAIQDKEHLIVIKRGIERLLFALLEAVFDQTDSVAVTSLTLLTRYAHSAHNLPEHAPLNATKRATSRTIWQILVASLPRLSERFSTIFSHNPVTKSSLSNSSHQMSTPFRHLRDSTTAFAQMAAHVLSQPADPPENPDVPDSNLRDAQRRAINWIETVLLPLSGSTDVEMSSSACLSLFLVAGFSSDNPSDEKVFQWGVHGVRNIIRLLSQDDNPVPSIVASGWVRDVVYALAALSKSELVTTKFIISSSIALLPYAATCPARQRRLEALTLIAFTVVEYDLSGRDTSVAVVLKAILKSDSWRSVLAESKTDSTVSSELICCIGMSLLESARKIGMCPDADMQLNLTHTWAVMLSLLMRSSVECLNWAHSPASMYAKEVFLKLFSAAGQYSSFLMRSQGIGMEEYEHMQEILVKATLEQEEVSIQASLLVCVTKYWLTSGMRAEGHTGLMLKAIWKHVQQHYRDEEVFRQELKTGALWSEAKQGDRTPAERAVQGGYISLATRVGKRTRAVWENVSSTVSTAIETRLFGSIALSTAAEEGSTLTTDYIYSGLSALIALVGHNPPLTEKSIALLEKYIRILEQAESADYIALEAVRNTMMVLKTYEGEHFPKVVDARPLVSIIGQEAVMEGESTQENRLAWLDSVTDNCVFASSRLSDPSRELSTVTSEEAVLHACAMSKRKLAPFGKVTMEEFRDDIRDSLEGDSQILHGSADPFSVVASHYMDTVKGLVLIRVQVMNRTSIRALNVSLHYASSGALAPLPDAPTRHFLGSMDQGVNVTQRITLAVRRHEGFAGKVFFSVRTKGEGASGGEAGYEEEQTVIPYYIPSADVLLLRRPPSSAGVDVFRRRWDAMRHCCSFQAVVRKSQNVDLLIDMLERKSKCLRQVGRMRTYSHVCVMVADSSSEDYVVVAALAPEATGVDGAGPCVVYLTIRSNSQSYCMAFREECRDWLKEGFRVIFPDAELSEDDKRFALRPQDAYFITDSDSNMTPYQRWRKAHAIRASL